MSAFYKQDEEDYYLRLVCPDCGDEVLLSEYRETVLCESCGEEHPISNAPTSISYNSTDCAERRTTE